MMMDDYFYDFSEYLCKNYTEELMEYKSNPDIIQDIYRDTIKNGKIVTKELPFLNDFGLSEFFLYYFLSIMGEKCKIKMI